jgi:hypothetical protein
MPILLDIEYNRRMAKQAPGGANNTANISRPTEIPTKLFEVHRRAFVMNAILHGTEVGVIRPFTVKSIRDQPNRDHCDRRAFQDAPGRSIVRPI